MGHILRQTKAMCEAKLRVAWPSRPSPGRPPFSGRNSVAKENRAMNQFAGMDDAHLLKLRNQLRLDPSPQAQIQLERVIAELRRRGVR